MNDDVFCLSECKTAITMFALNEKRPRSVFRTSFCLEREWNAKIKEMRRFFFIMEKLLHNRWMDYFGHNALTSCGPQRLTLSQSRG